MTKHYNFTPEGRERMREAGRKTQASHKSAGRKIRSSAWIPDGLLPPSNHPDYAMIYYRLRVQYDPNYAEYQRKGWKKRATKKRENARCFPAGMEVDLGNAHRSPSFAQ